MLVGAARLGLLSRHQQAFATCETALGVAVWALHSPVIAPGPFVFAFVLPLVAANVMVMGLIFTNDSLSPLTEAVVDGLDGSIVK